MLLKSNHKWSGKPGKPEYLFCEINLAEYDLIFIGIVYRPPHSPFHDLPKILSDQIDGYRHKIIMGDFNADQLSNSDDAKLIRFFMGDNTFKLVQHGATHLVGSSRTWLDLCMVDQYDCLVYHIAYASCS